MGPTSSEWGQLIPYSRQASRGEARPFPGFLLRTPRFERLPTSTNHPWYSSPIDGITALFRESKPTLKFFPTLLAVVALFSTASAQLPPPPVPPGNPITPEKARLGKALFWDEQLSSTGTVSCGTCHMPEAGGSDPRTLSSLLSIHPGPDGVIGGNDDIRGSQGVPRHVKEGQYEKDPVFGFHARVTDRKAPSAIGSGYSKQLFWDGRAGEVLIDPLTSAVILTKNASLESQVLGPPTSEVEMGHIARGWDEVIARLAPAEPLALSDHIPQDLETWIAGRDYPALFQEAFGTPEVSPSRIAMAIATYERTLVPDQTPWDRVLAGEAPNSVLSGPELQGLLTFLDPEVTGCGDCHNSGLFTTRFTDERFHFIGVRPRDEDLGRFNVTGLPGDQGKFRTPALRNVELRAPYMHNGSLDDLREVVEFYDRGGDFDAPNKHPSIRDLNLSESQKRVLLAFLKRPLTDPRVAQALPPFDRPSQYADSVHVPEVYGSATAGSGGWLPEIVAIEPPKLGAERLTIALDRALGGAPALLLMNTSQAPGGVLRHGALLYPTQSGSFLRSLPALEGAGPGEGWGSVVLPVPEDPQYLGTSLYAQWVVLDSGAPGRLAASPAIRLSWY